MPFDNIIIITLVTVFGINGLALIIIVLNIRGRQRELKKQINTMHKNQLMLNEQHISRKFEQLKAFTSLSHAFSRGTHLPAMHGWTIFPDLALRIIQAIDELKPAIVVEFGGGASTVLCAQRFKENGYQSRIYSFEHNEYYATETREKIERKDLSKNVEIIHAPLEASAFKNNEDQFISWYEKIQLKRIPSEVNLVIIDGPPTSLDPWSRYPALPLIYSRLAQRCVIILDDANRSEESAIIERWLKEYPEFSLTLEPTEKGAAILERYES